MLDTILKEHGPELLAALTGGGGLDGDQADRLLQPALSGIGEALTGGRLDLGQLLGGGDAAASSLLGQLDVGAIASAAGLTEGQAGGGLASLVPIVLSLLAQQGGGADGLLSMLGGSGGAAEKLGGLAGKLFGGDG